MCYRTVQTISWDVMMNEDPIAVIIATSKGRTHLLVNRSLRSVYTQEGVNPLEVVIVDDNSVPPGREFSEEYSKIKDGIKLLRKEILEKTYYAYIRDKKEVSFDQFFKTTLLKNVRTHGHSGTGAWNTAIYYFAKKYPKDEIFVAILDDDDEYKEGYLSECSRIIKEEGRRIAAIFPYIQWIRKENIIDFRFSEEDLNPRAFFIGNPGVQGSNMCIRLDLLENIGGFNENLHSATDRDLMIRLLSFIKENRPYLKIRIIPQVMVLHYADRPDRVTNNKKLKKIGLDTFYSKWKDHFPREDFIKSLERARRLFGYEYEF